MGQNINNKKRHISHVSILGYVLVRVMTFVAKQCGHCEMDVGCRPSGTFEVELLLFMQVLILAEETASAGVGKDAVAYVTGVAVTTGVATAVAVSTSKSWEDMNPNQVSRPTLQIM